MPHVKLQDLPSKENVVTEPSCSKAYYGKTKCYC